MFSTLSPLKAMVLVAKIYAAFVTLLVFILFLCGVEVTLQQALRVVGGGAVVLEVSLFVLGSFLWRKLWGLFPVLNDWVFPDLNGMWDMDIAYVWDGTEGSAKAVATIKQSLFSVSMEVHSESSDSETLAVKTIKDINSARPVLYYFYRVVPKVSKGVVGSGYEGASILKLYGHEGDILRGNYFTSNNSQGRFSLAKR
ncbi:hypothetical protein HX787_28335 [Pseudomonas tolaasii]|uniref:CD-NTase-associated protein 15 domain-containing protein n=2 Tax=Pseudomonas tolaasii TaxID=29442 RepID=A0A7Y8AU00_PSETO|nr:hypothetical protein [Pseudomonas tolaasii]ARB31267.1 hypothetical protein B5P22_29480 [Pseudomonas tolaasii]KAB0466520.1 hypothetical protein F7R12_27515 [Pseudomonas tolaasii]MBY8943493.1 hypothetical protein [Pseudomonas tolaasii]NWC23956.1 hypothetical protein [Pseudomonas tolaasii]NWC28900.1 hypothetical protein [Pseudomonas tolaasii]